MIPWLISVGLSKQSVYSNNPRILEDLKHNNELVTAGNDQQTLKKAAKSTVQKTDACLQGQGHFQHLL
jgi:hypothetical protein